MPAWNYIMSLCIWLSKTDFVVVSVLFETYLNGLYTNLLAKLGTNMKSNWKSKSLQQAVINTDLQHL